MKYFYTQRGFSLAEIVVSIAILSAISYSVSIFQRDVFSLSATSQQNLSAQLEGRHVIKEMTSEIREASASSLGSYTIALASSSALTIYSDINNDGLKERIRYYVSGSNLKKGVVTPTGSPLVYIDANEKTTTLISSVVSSSTVPVFRYYTSAYAGTTTPLAQPVNISAVRLVEITVMIDKDQNRSPMPIVVTTKVMIRNLKDNL